MVEALWETKPLSSANCFAECQKSGTRQSPSFPGSRQKRGTRHRLPRVTVFGHVLLYRVPAVRQSAKIFLENTLPSAPDTVLGKYLIFFFEMSLPSAPVKALGKEEISKKNSKTSLPSALVLALGQDPLCRVPCPGAQQSFFFAFKFFVQPF